MLEELRIRDLGVITDATLPLGPGLSVVTGETGAGKTMVVTAVGLLLGARSDAGAVRSGAKSASAEAVLKLDAGHAAVARSREAGAEVEEFDGGVELLLARSVGADGRSRAYLGGRAAPVGVLAEIGETLVVVHGQSDQIRLKSPVAQRGALDKFAGESLAGALAAYQDLYAHWHASQGELDALRSAARERLREAESLQVALAEIDAVDPQPGEDEALKAEAVKLANVEELRIAASTAHQALIAEDFGEEADATTLVDAAKRTLEHVAEHDGELGSAAARLAEVGFLLNDIAAELASYQAALDTEGPERLAEIEDRRAALAKLVRKYAPSIDEVLVWAEEARARHEELQDDSTRIEALDAEVARAETELRKKAAGDQQGPHARPPRTSPRGSARSSRRWPWPMPPWSSMWSPRASWDRSGPTRSPSCFSRTPARRPGRWAKAPRAVNSPASCSPSRWCWPPSIPSRRLSSTRSTPASAAVPPSRSGAGWRCWPSTSRSSW